MEGLKEAAILGGWWGVASFIARMFNMGGVLFLPGVAADYITLLIKLKTPIVSFLYSITPSGIDVIFAISFFLSIYIGSLIGTCAYKVYGSIRHANKISSTSHNKDQKVLLYLKK